jgi:hypothetical protein
VPSFRPLAAAKQYRFTNNVMMYTDDPVHESLLDELLDNLTDLHTYAFELVQGQRGKVHDTVIARLAGSLDESKKTPA